jgi:hypothetical protein
MTTTTTGRAWHASTVTRGLPLLPLVASNARDARPGAGRCAVCRRELQPGQRIADLADGTGAVHIAPCSAAAVPAPTRKRG